MALQLRLVFGLPWRQTEGLLRSVLHLHGLALDIPDHTTLSRRACQLRIKPAIAATRRPIHLIVDATSLRIFEQGEWARAKHGSHDAHAGWRKLHIGIDADGAIVTAELTDSSVADASAFPSLVRKVKSPIKKVTTDGSYDRRQVWKVIDDLGAHAVIRLRRGAMLRGEEAAKVGIAIFEGSGKWVALNGDEILFSKEGS